MYNRRVKEKLNKISMLGDYLAADRTEQQVLDMAMIVARDMLGFNHAIFRKLTGDELVTVAAYGFPREAIDIPIRVGEGVTGFAVANSAPVLIPDTTKDDRFITGVENCRSELCVPVKYGNEVIGSINVEHDQPSWFKDEDLLLLEHLSTQFAAALEAVSLRDQLSKKEKLSIVGEMTGSILHDIRNDIHTLKISADMLESIDTNDERISMISDLVRKSGNNIHTLIEDLFEFVRYGNTKIRKNRQNLSTLLDSVRARVEHKIEHDQKVEIDIECDNSISIDVDAQKFRRVLLNLATNGIEAMKEGGRLSILASANDAQATISISDTGCGISPEDIEKIWEPLYTRGKKGGTGLGMAIVSKIIEEHGFSISVDSTPGSGTTFKVSIPAP